MVWAGAETEYDMKVSDRIELVIMGCVTINEDISPKC